MDNIVAEFIGSKITNELERQKINEDYETKLKPQINKNTKQFIDSICTYLSNSNLQVCEAERKAGNITNEVVNQLKKEDPVKFIKDASIDFIEQYLDVSPDEFSSFFLNYKPITTNVIQSGGDMDDWRIAKDNAEADAAKNVTGANVVPDANAVTGSNGVNMPVNSNLDISKLTQGLEDKNLKHTLIKTNKATELFDFYRDQINLRLSCSHDIHEYINDKIINTLFYTGLTNIKQDNANKIKSLMLPISQRITQTVTNDKIKALKNNIKTYKLVFNAFKTQEKYVETSKPHINAYLLILLEFFLYFKHNEVLNEPFIIDTKLDEINECINILKSTELKEMVKTELVNITITNIENINNLNKLITPNKEKPNPIDHNEKALKDFKELFEEKKKEEEKTGGKTGGKRKQQSKRKGLRKKNSSRKKNR